MQVLSNPINKKIIVTVVCSLHGEEVFPAKIFEYLKKNLDQYPGLKIILAHEEALKKGVRFFDTDLNRSFPGKKDGNYEERLAYQIKKEIKNCKYLIDLHTSVTDIQLTPIVTKINRKTKRIINLQKSAQIIYVKKPLAGQALIGQINNGVSLECGRQHTKGPAMMRSILQLINDLIHDKKRKPRARKIFTVTGTLSKSTPIPKNAKNFKYIKALKIYPILYHKDAYRHIHCLAATKMKQIKI